MASADAKTFLRSLDNFGINLETSGVAMIREDMGLLQPNEWLEFDHVDGSPVVRLKGSACVLFARPVGWSPGEPHFLLRREDLKTYWTFITEQDGVSTYLDPATGEYFYIGRPNIPRRSQPWWRFWA
jgi:hypothetical protein